MDIGKRHQSRANANRPGPGTQGKKWRSVIEQRQRLEFVPTVEGIGQEFTPSVQALSVTFPS